MRQSIPQAEQDQAAALLRAQAVPGQFPGAATTRLHGRYANLGFGVQAPQITPTLLIFHWEIEFMQEFADATAHGDFWRVRIPLTQDWQGRVQGYMPRAGTSLLAAVSDNVSNSSIGADPLFNTLTLYNDAGTHVIFQGICWAQRGRVMAPQAMVTQELELVSAQVPTTMMAA